MHPIKSEVSDGGGGHGGYLPAYCCVHLSLEDWGHEGYATQTTGIGTVYISAVIVGRKEVVITDAALQLASLMSRV